MPFGKNRKAEHAKPPGAGIIPKPNGEGGNGDYGQNGFRCWVSRQRCANLFPDSVAHRDFGPVGFDFFQIRFELLEIRFHQNLAHIA